VQRKANTPLMADAASGMPVFLIAAVIAAATAARAQQGELSNPSGVCATAKTAAVRLICADPDLSARDAKLAAAYRQKKSRMPLAAQTELANEQLAWMRQRDQKCGLVGKNSVSLDELRKAKECIQSEIDTRLIQLQKAAQLNTPSSPPAANVSTATANNASAAPGVAVAPTFSQNAVAGSQDIVVTPAVSLGTGETGSTGKFHFSALASGVSGTADCGAIASAYAVDLPAAVSAVPRPMIEITLNDDVSSFTLFENERWRSVLDKVRQAVRAKCIDASVSKNNSSGGTNKLNELYEINSSQGLFLAHGSGLDGVWSVETNMPGMRKKFQSDLGVQKWIEASALTRNPYFFKDMVVGMIVRLDQRISDHEAVFARSGALIFVSNVPQSFVNQQLVVLAGRVMGNKGVVNPSGSEQLMPALEYLGTSDCGQACEALSSLAAQ
jgi:uncharacterized protein YecT (DUF1311 family)